MNKNAMKVIEKVLWVCIFSLLILALLSLVLIVSSESNRVFDFTSVGFSVFLSLFSVPIKLLSAAVAMLSLWTVVHNIYRTRLAFIHGQYTNELLRCEDEIKEILSKKVTPEEIILIFQNKLSSNSNLRGICNYFAQIANSELSIDEIVPHLTKLGLSEDCGVYRTSTQHLTLCLTRYTLVLLELNETSEDKMFVRYYANKYISLMIDLYHYKAEMDIALPHICFQLSSVQLRFDYDFNKINGAEHILITEKFQKKVATQKI
jgi:hypothetical protein